MLQASLHGRSQRGSAPPGRLLEVAIAVGALLPSCRCHLVRNRCTLRRVQGCRGGAAG